jgi:hypothetical protein
MDCVLHGLKLNQTNNLEAHLGIDQYEMYNVICSLWTGQR